MSTGYVDEVSYVFPSNLAENVEKLHREFFGQEDYTISATVSNISAAIVQKIEAARQSNQLKDEETEVEPNKPQETVPETPTKPADPVEPTVPSEPTEPSVDPDNPGTTDPTPEEPTNPGTSTDPGTTTPDPDVPDGSGSGNTGGNTSSSGAGIPAAHFKRHKLRQRSSAKPRHKNIYPRANKYIIVNKQQQTFHAEKYGKFCSMMGMQPAVILSMGEVF
ncbi:MAG: hypothetical protein ACLTK0_05915 [Anaerovoracaceae bacterium]